ncbi:MAG: hypothetical protein RL216_3450 [Pseudomonadota bacterium]|jgi:uncharacterized membrane protein
MVDTKDGRGAAVPAGKPGGGKGLRIALGVSVALNLLVAGLVAGAMLREGGPRDRMLRDLDFGPLTEALSDADRDALRRAFVARSGGFRDVRAEMRADFDALLRALRVEPFDAEAVRGLLLGQQARVQDRLMLGQDLLLERLTAMSPAARAEFADRLEQRLRRGPGGRDGHGSGG